jgi:mannan endo-1,4-beta-mannosidase
MLMRPASCASLALLAALLGSCITSLPNRGSRATPPNPAQVVAAYHGPEPLSLSDAEARATRRGSERVRQILQQLASDSRFALGHQDSTAYGVGWSGDADRSDIKGVCGSHPAVRGWDLFKIELGAKENGDGVSFDLMRARIREAHRAGALNTASWHLDNPVSGGDAWDSTRAVEHIIPGGSHHDVYRIYLDRAADFLQSLRGDEGELIPIIFRPFHEHTGHWFWWGSSRATDEQFVTLWRFTVDHLRKRRGLSHLILALPPSADALHSQADYFYRYPGDEYVDVFGVDHYYESDATRLVRALEIAVRAAEARGKVAALTEFGFRSGLGNQAVSVEHWFSRYFFEPLAQSPIAPRIAYALAWRNANMEHFFVPFPGHSAAADLRRVCADPRVLLERDLAPSR